MRAWNAIVGAAMLAGAAFGQSQPPRDPPPPSREPSRETDPAAYRARLERMLEDSKQRQAKIQAALQKLDGGASMDDVRKDLEQTFRPRGSGGGGDRPPEGPTRVRRDRPDEGPDQPGAGPLEPEAVVSFLEQHSAEWGKQLRAFLKDNPDGAQRFIGRLTPHIREIMTERDVEMRELRINGLKNGWDILAAARRFREASRASDAPAKQKAAGEIRTLLGAGFDNQTKLHEREIAVLEERIARLRQDIEKQRGDREGFITRRLEQMTSDNPGRGSRPPEPPKK